MLALRRMEELRPPGVASCGVTVVVPTRNRAGRILTALSGALGQEGVDHEVIVVDDCSTDGTAATLAAIRHPRLRVLRQESHRGVAASRNAGIAGAKGKWVAFLDDDDVWSPHKLRRVIDCTSAQGAAFAYSAAVIVNDRLEVTQHAPAPDPGGIRRRLLTHNAVPGGCSNVVAKTELVRGLGGFDEELSVLADWDLWIRLAQTAMPAACPEPLVAYVRHEESMVAGGQQDVVSEVRRVVAKHRDAARADGVELDVRGLYRYFARAHRRAGRRLPASRMYLRSALASRSPGDALRAGGVLLGERAAMARSALKGDRYAKTGDAPAVIVPAWLDAYRLECAAGEDGGPYAQRKQLARSSR